MPLVGTSTPLISVNRSSNVPISHQIYERVREAVLTGQLRSGDLLPSSRALAKELALARKTVQDAYAQLISEGYIDGKVGSGTRVAQIVRPIPASRSHANHKAAPVAGHVSKRGTALVNANAIIFNDPWLLPLRPCVPAIDAFPYKLWAGMLGWSARSAAAEAETDPAGYLPLREEIARHLRTVRAVRCEADNIVITDGTQQALDLAARLLLDEQDSIWFEDPGYSVARAAFLASGLSLLPVPVDDEGLNVEYGRKRFPRAHAVYVTPSHQYPIGSTLSLRRRLDLLSWAEAENAWIFEDDYDSEYRYDGKPLGALQGISSGDRVIYFGTFSKVLLPSFRLGYVVASAHLARQFAAARAVSMRHSSAIPQVALARFMSEGYFANHMRKMRALYEERQGVLLESVRRRLRGEIEVKTANAGMHLTAYFVDANVDDRLVSTHARKQGICARALSYDAMGPPPVGGLVLGYGATSPSIIDQGVLKLRAAIREARREK